jgi:hypothetical protein
MKKYIVFIACVLAVFAFVGDAYAQTPSGYNSLRLKERASPGTPASGYLYLYVDTSGNLIGIDDAGASTTYTGVSAVTLDAAYDTGGAAAGRTITVDGGAVTLTNTDADATSLLAVTNNPSSSAAGDGITITMGSSSTGDGIEFENTGSGADIEGTGNTWSVSKAGNMAVNNITVGGTLDVTGATTLSGSLYQAAIASASTGNVALTVDAAGNGAIGIGSISTGAVTITPATTIVGATTLTGALTANGNVTLGNAAGDNITVTGSVVAALTLDDGSGASPDFIMQDATDENATFSKVDSGYLTITTAAADGVSVRDGNFSVGDGSVTETHDGEDMYVEGIFENDGGMYLDGTTNLRGATVFTGATNTFTQGAAEYTVFNSAAHTDTTGTVIVNTVAGATNVRGMTLDFEAENTFNQGYGLYINVDDDATGGEETVEAIYIENDAGTASTVNGITLANTLDVGVNVLVGAAKEAINIDAAATDHTGTAGVIDMAVDTITSTASAINIDFEMLAGGGADEVTAVMIDLTDSSDSAGEIIGITLDSSTPGGSSGVYGLSFTDNAGAATGLTQCIHAETPAGGQYLVLDAATVDSTQTSGVIDIDFDTLTTAAMALNLKTTLLASAGAGVEVTGAYFDVDDDSDSASTVTAITIDSTDATGSSEVRGIAFETIAGADTLLDTCMYAETDADTQVLVVDSAGTDYTGAEGVVDINFDSATAAAAAINVKVTHVAGGSGQKVAGIEVEMDSDADNASDETYGLLVNVTDATDTGTLTGILIEGAGLDTGVQVDHGGIRIGTGSSPSQTLGDDTLYAEGLVEIEGSLYVDGTQIVGDGATELVGVRHDTVDGAATNPYTVTAAMSGTVFYNSQAIEFDLPADPTGLEFTFVVDHASNLDVDPNGTDRIWAATDTNGDYIRSATVGDTVTLVGTDADSWFVKAMYPVNTDWSEE